MSNIKNISSKFEPLQKPQTQQPTSPKKDFGNELLKTLEKLEQIGTEIDEVLNTSKPNNPTRVRGEVNSINQWINNIEGIIDNISTEKDESEISQQAAVKKYNQMSKKEHS